MMIWRKSSHSPPDWIGDKQCVEVGTGDGLFAFRDSKNPDGGVLYVYAEALGGFLSAVKAGDFDRTGG